MGAFLQRMRGDAGAVAAGCPSCPAGGAALGAALGCVLGREPLPAKRTAHSASSPSSPVASEGPGYIAWGHSTAVGPFAEILATTGAGSAGHTGAAARQLCVGAAARG